MTRRRARKLPRGALAATAGFIRQLADRVESGDVTAQLQVAITADGEIWVVSAHVPRHQDN